MPRQPARLKSAPPEGLAAPGRFFMRLAVGARGSFAVRGSWIAGIVFFLLFFPARFDSGRPHHLAGTPYRFHKAHDGFLHAFSPSPGACGRILRARTRRRPRKAVTGLCALFLFPAAVAQLAEQPPYKRQAVRSRRTGGTISRDPVTGHTERMMVFNTLSPHHRELAGVPFAPAPAGGPRKALRLCAFIFLF